MTDKEYIDKVAFNYAIREAVKKYPNSFYNGLEVARQIAHDFPAADVRPVVRGEWVQVMGKYDWMVKCSRCNGVPIETSNFCPNCGAEMEES